MTHSRKRPDYGIAICLIVTIVLSMYFVLASVQGDYGLFQRVQIEAETAKLQDELAALDREVATMENRTRRLSDRYLDLDLLDEQARDVLGLVRSDEVVLR